MNGIKTLSVSVAVAISAIVLFLVSFSDISPAKAEDGLCGGGDGQIRGVVYEDNGTNYRCVASFTSKRNYGACRCKL